MSISKEPLIPPQQEQKLSFFQIFFQKTLKNQKKTILLLCLLFSMSSAMIFGVPILFKSPKIICLPEKEECFEEIGCLQQHEIDFENGTKSLSADYGLICENKSPKIFAVSLL